MLKECLEIFENELHEKGENLILDSYIPADGTYIVVSKINNKFQIKDEAINIKYNKKTDELEGRMNTLYEDICFYDYNSKLVDMNKPIDKKKIIQSNNYLSFFIKKGFPSQALANFFLRRIVDIQFVRTIMMISPTNPIGNHPSLSIPTFAPSYCQFRFTRSFTS